MEPNVIKVGEKVVRCFVDIATTFKDRYSQVCRLRGRVDTIYLCEEVRSVVIEDMYRMLGRHYGGTIHYEYASYASGRKCHAYEITMMMKYMNQGAENMIVVFTVESPLTDDELLLCLKQSGPFLVQYGDMLCF